MPPGNAAGAFAHPTVARSGRDIAVAELVGNDHVLFGPQRQYRLIAAIAVIGPLGRPFVAGNRSVQAVAQSMCAIKRRDPASPSNLLQIFDRMDDLRGKAVVDSLGCRHPVIPVGVPADPLDRLSGLGGDDLAKSLTHLDVLALLYVDVRCWALHAA